MTVLNWKRMLALPLIIGITILLGDSCVGGPSGPDGGWGTSISRAK